MENNQAREDKSLSANSDDDNNYQVTERTFDPERQAKEEYMRRLMNFRKDELIIPDESEDDYDEDEDDTFIVKNKIMHNIEEAYDLVDQIEDKMNRVTNTIRGLDKRMSHNNRLLGSLVMFEGLSDNEKEEKTPFLGTRMQNNILYSTSLADKKAKVIPKLKRMSQFAISKLNLTSDLDVQKIEMIK